jgi:N-acyl-D-amino-acid deacylase
MRILVFLLALSASGETYDLLIRNALVLDGAGAPPFAADIAVSQGRIVRIGALPPDAAAARVINAGGRIAAPGFIDVHTHVEGAVEKIPRGDNYLLDGVTTIVTGNCGGSASKIGEWLAMLEKRGLGLNLATLVGHNTVRSEVMGTANRLATPDEIARMQALVDQGMREGAVGFSTGLIYIPGTYSNPDEVVALARAAARHNGVYASHMRDEGARILDAIHEAARVGQEAGMKVQLSHFKIDTPRIWGFSEKSLALVDEYRAKGVPVFLDQYPYDRASTNLGITLPSWALADGAAQIRQRLTDPATRRKIAAEMKEMLIGLGHPDYHYATVASFSPNKEYEGKTIREITLLRGKQPTLDHQIDTIFDMLLKSRAQMVYHSMGDVDIDRIMRWPLTAIASDGGIREFGQGMPHPRSYGTNARVLAEYVRNRQVLTLPDAVRRMTSLPASTFQFTQRGRLAEGLAADILLFDPARVQDKATYPQPHAYSEGFDYVFVNGIEMVSHGQLTSARGGQVLRGPGYRP